MQQLAGTVQLVRRAPLGSTRRLALQFALLVPLALTLDRLGCLCALLAQVEPLLRQPDSAHVSRALLDLTLPLARQTPYARLVPLARTPQPVGSRLAQGAFLGCLPMRLE